MVNMYDYMIDILYDKFGKDYVIQDLIRLFYGANSIMIKQDESEMVRNVNERTVCGFLMNKFNSLLPLYGFNGYYSDVEYSCGPGGTLKTVEGLKDSSWIVADIIVHSRGKKKFDNLICIEMKKSSRDSDAKARDKERLSLMTSGDTSYIRKNRYYVLDYLLGIYYEYNAINKTIYLEFYKNGVLFDNKTITFEDARRMGERVMVSDNKFTFHPVGQGLFYSGLIDNGRYSFVYDCGNEKRNPDLVPMIDTLKNEMIRERLDFLAISHFHEDHIRFIPELVYRLNPKKIILPYLFEDDDLRLLYIYGSVANNNMELESFNFENVFLLNNLYNRDS